MTGEIVPAVAGRRDGYDGFISYSHAADDLLAPRLQAGLQRFAKPWWKRRAVRIFRDESSLSANPHLWSSITEALDTSGWFVLLLSPDAARSEWVNQEIEYWKTNRDPSRILPVVTDGTFGWTHGDITGDSVPGALTGVFAEEPRWVDLRWAKDEDQLDLQDPRFADAVADIASTIRGIPKDDLASEEVKQHRRTIRTAGAGGILVTLLAIAAVGFGITSAQNAAEAEEQAQLAAEQADLAETNAEDARANAAEAERQRVDAEANAQAATRQATLASAASLASGSRAELSADPELALLLALQSLRTASTDEGTRALGQALQAHRAFLTLEPADGVSFEGGGGVVPVLAPDGYSIATLELSLGTAKRTQLYRIADLVAEQRGGGTALPVWTVEAGDDLGFWIAVFSVDGTEVIAFEGPEAVIGSTGQLAALSNEVAGRRRLVAFDATTGEVTRSVIAPPCSNPNPMATGRPVDVSLPLLLDVYPEVDGSCDVTADRALVLFDLDTGDTTTVTESYPSFGFGTGFPSLSRDGTRVAYAQGAPSSGHPPGAVIDLATGEVLLELDGGDSMLSPDGSRVLTGSHADSPLELWDVDRAIKLREFPGDMNTSDFSPDGTIVYGGVTDGSIVLFDASSGAELIRLRGQGTESLGVGMDERQSILASFSIDGSTWLWDIGRQLIGESGMPDVVPPDGRFVGGFQHRGGRLAATWTPDSTASGGPFRAAFYDPVTAELLFDLPGFVVAISPDGQTAAIQEWSEEPTRLTADEARAIGCVRCENPPGGEYWSVGTVQVIDLDSLDVVAEMPALCTWLNHTTAELPGPDCDQNGSRIDWITNASFSPDGTLLAVGGFAGVVTVWDPIADEILWENVSQANTQAFLSDLVSLEFSPDGSHLFAWTSSESAAVVLDTSTWDEVARIPVGSSGYFTQAQFTPDGALLLVGDNLHHVVVIDTSTWERLEPLRGQSGNFLPDLDISPSGRFVATAGYGGNAWIWDLEDRSVVRKWTVPSGRPVWDVEFIDDETLLIVPDGGPGAWAGVSMTLDVETQTQNALRRLTRSFTLEECETYGIDPCPTLESLRAG